MVTVVQHIVRYTKELNPIIENQLRNLRCCQLAFLCPAGYQPVQLAKLVNYNHQRIVTINLRQISHEINGTCVKFAIRNRRQLQQTSRTHIHVFGALAHLTASDKMLYVHSQIWPPNTSKQCRRCFSNTQMSCVVCIVQLFQQ